MNILSMDPGVAKVGIAITSDTSLVHCEFLTEPIPKPLQFHMRCNNHMQYLIPLLGNLLVEYEVTHVAWEIVPSFAAFRSRDLVIATADVLKVLTFQNSLPYCAITPQAWHKTLMGSTKDITKQLVKDKITSLYPNLKDDFPYDVYDAIGINIVARQKNTWIGDKNA